MVGDAEKDVGADDGLSGMLGDGDARGLAGVCAFVLDGEDWILHTAGRRIPSRRNISSVRLLCWEVIPSGTSSDSRDFSLKAVLQRALSLLCASKYLC